MVSTRKANDLVSVFVYIDLDSIHQGPFWRTVILYGSGIASMLAGGSVMHGLLKPDLTLPPVKLPEEAQSE